MHGATIKKTIVYFILLNSPRTTAMCKMCMSEIKLSSFEWLPLTFIDNGEETLSLAVEFLER
jgi:hypothetical protein